MDSSVALIAVDHGFSNNRAVIRIAASPSSDNSFYYGFACTHLPNFAGSIKFDWYTTDVGLRESYTDTSWAQCLSATALPEEDEGVPKAHFLLLTQDVKLRVLTIWFDTLTYEALESVADLSYMSSIKPESFDAHAFEFDTDVQAFFGTTTTYFSHATLSKDVGFIQMTHDNIRFTPDFFSDASIATMTPDPGV